MAGDLADDHTQDDDAIADARRFGMAPEEIDNLRATLGRTKGRGLWRRHVNAFQALLAGATQWRHVVAIGADGSIVERIVGLDYSGLKVALDGLGLILKPAEWRQLMILEAAAVGAKNGAPAPMLEEA